jgi:sec-independent protein translocase protein TatB
MFNIGLGEMLFIAILALIALGPERLPKLMRQLGELAYQVRQVVQQFNTQFADELKPIREIQSLTTELNPMRQIGAALDPSLPPPPSIAPPSAAPAQVVRSVSPAVSSAPHPMAQISRQMAAHESAPAADPPPAPPSAESPLADGPA